MVTCATIIILLIFCGATVHAIKWSGEVILFWNMVKAKLMAGQDKDLDFECRTMYKSLLQQLKNAELCMNVTHAMYRIG